MGRSRSARSSTPRPPRERPLRRPSESATTTSAAMAIRTTLRSLPTSARPKRRPRQKRTAPESGSLFLSELPLLCRYPCDKLFNAFVLYLTMSSCCALYKDLNFPLKIKNENENTIRKSVFQKKKKKKKKKKKNFFKKKKKKKKKKS